MKHVFKYLSYASLGVVGFSLGVGLTHPSQAFQSFQANPLKAIDVLVKIYEGQIAGREDNTLIWKDGSKSDIDDFREKSHQQALKGADIHDMMVQRYPIGDCSFEKPSVNFDPGRIRNDAFMKKIYGSSKQAVRSKLKSIPWFGKKVAVTTVNNVHIQLGKVHQDLQNLVKANSKMRKFLAKPGGTFNWRKIAGTDRLSVHSFGAAVDINTDFTDYWRWSKGSKPGKVTKYKNKIPHEIVKVFENHGFIWGGKWYHYDTMHFEYRPELIETAVQVDCP